MTTTKRDKPKSNKRNLKIKGGKWSMKYKKVLIVITPKDFLKDNIANMGEPTKKEKYKSLYMPLSKYKINKQHFILYYIFHYETELTREKG